MKEEVLRTLFIYGVVIICVVALALGAYLTFAPNYTTQTQNSEQTNTITDNENNISYDSQEKDFYNIFTGTLNINGETPNIPKVEEQKELIYTKYQYDKTTAGYELDVQIPNINIESNVIEGVNQEINNHYTDRIKKIADNPEEFSIYHSRYVAYINGGVLSVVMKELVKTGDNPQSLFITTYNYDLKQDILLNINQMLELKGLQKEEVQNTIIQKIEKANKNAESLKELGYNVYERNPQSDFYKIDNAKTFFLGPNNGLYILYSYGEFKETTELDIIIV